MTDTRKTTASFTFHGTEFTDVPVINPGGWFGKTWILGIGGSFTMLFFVVEADSSSDAIDEFADSDEHGHHINVPDEDMADYDEETASRAGNDGHVVDLDWLDILTDGDACDVLYHVEGIDDPVNPPDLDSTLERAEKRAEWEDQVSRPGKFEGESAYVPYFWDAFLNGMADDDENDVHRFDVTDEDTAIFPELIGRESVYLYECSDGFVNEVDGFGESEDDAYEDTDDEDASEDE